MLRPVIGWEESSTMKTDNPTEKEAEEPRAEESGRTESGPEESIASGAGTAKKVSRALKDTAHKYLDAAGLKVDLDDIEKRIQDRPLFCLLLAASAGFVVGGGLTTNMGVALLGLFGRKAAVETGTSFGRQVLRRAVSGGEAAA
jgi:hypothetical protein